MDLMQAFSQVCQEFTGFRAAVDRALPAVDDPATRRELQRVTARMDQTYAELQQSFPKAVAELEQEKAATAAKAKQSQQTLTELQAKLDAQAAAGETAPTPAPPPIAVDPGLGKLLRGELLERFGEPVSQAPGKKWEAGPVPESWEDWDRAGWERPS